eukprot:4900180-Karenia_brevis.AAC.1
MRFLPIVLAKGFAFQHERQWNSGVLIAFCPDSAPQVQVVREVKDLVGSRKAEVGRQAESHKHPLHAVHTFII